MIDYNKLGKYIDNIYTGSSDSSSRKVIASLSNNTLTLNFRSIVNVGRKEELEKRKKELENEAIQLISKKKKEISDGYNNEAETKIKLKVPRQRSKLKMESNRRVFVVGNGMTKFLKPGKHNFDYEELS